MLDVQPAGLLPMCSVIVSSQPSKAAPQRVQKVSTAAASTRHRGHGFVSLGSCPPQWGQTGAPAARVARQVGHPTSAPVTRSGRET